MSKKPSEKMPNPVSTRSTLTKHEIVEKAVAKAIKNGWDMLGCHTFDYQIKGTTIHTFKVNKGDGVAYEKELHTSHYLFSHDFAKALWGAEWPDGPGGTGLVGFTSVPRWKSHLSDMVVADDPIAYLGANI